MFYYYRSVTKLREGKYIEDTNFFLAIQFARVCIVGICTQEEKLSYVWYVIQFAFCDYIKTGEIRNINGFLDPVTTYEELFFLSIHEEDEVWHNRYGRCDQEIPFHLISQQHRHLY